MSRAVAQGDDQKEEQNNGEQYKHLKFDYLHRLILEIKFNNNALILSFMDKDCLGTFVNEIKNRADYLEIYKQGEKSLKIKKWYHIGTVIGLIVDHHYLEKSWDPRIELVYQYIIQRLHKPSARFSMYGKDAKLTMALKLLFLLFSPPKQGLKKTIEDLEAVHSELIQGKLGNVSANVHQLTGENKLTKDFCNGIRDWNPFNLAIEAESEPNKNINYDGWIIQIKNIIDADKEQDGQNNQQPLSAAQHQFMKSLGNSFRNCLMLHLFKLKNSNNKYFDALFQYLVYREHQSKSMFEGTIFQDEFKDKHAKMNAAMSAFFYLAKNNFEVDSLLPQSAPIVETAAFDSGKLGRIDDAFKKEKQNVAAAAQRPNHRNI